MNIKRYTQSMALAAALVAGSMPTQAQSQAEAADKAFLMAAKYASMGYYITPNREGAAGVGTTLEFTMPVSQGLDYIVIVAGDKYALDVDLWIESEVGNTIQKDDRKVNNGLSGVRWRSDYNGTVKIIVHFAKVKSRCGWAAIAGRRGSASFPDAGGGGAVLPGNAVPAGGKKLQPEPDAS